MSHRGDAELISVIVTTYNREDALDAALRALAHQTDRNFEIVIADDGSRPETARVVESWRSRLPMPLKHVRHEHCGFRGGEIRNRGIRASAGGICIFLDGDCLAGADFVAAHRRLHEPGWFVTGNRILLSRELTETVLAEGLAAETWNFTALLRERLRGGVNRLMPTLRLPLGPLRKLQREQLGGRANLQSRRRAAATSTVSTASIAPIPAGAWKTPTSWCGCCVPACGARMDASRPAFCICGIRKTTARNCPPTGPDWTR